MSGGGCLQCEARRSFLKRAAESVAGYLALGVVPTFVAGVRFGADDVSYPIPATDGVVVDKENEVILARRGNRVYAFALSCPHQRTMLKWLESDGRFQCPKHKSKYQPTGEFISGRATRNMDRYPIRVEGGKVVVTVSRTIESDQDRPGWAAAAAAV
jgi:nitrite reductase/ring-hydroxylating ferredoxin subunit